MSLQEPGLGKRFVFLTAETIQKHFAKVVHGKSVTGFGFGVHQRVGFLPIGRFLLASVEKPPGLLVRVRPPVHPFPGSVLSRVRFFRHGNFISRFVIRAGRRSESLRHQRRNELRNRILSFFRQVSGSIHCWSIRGKIQRLRDHNVLDGVESFVLRQRKPLRQSILICTDHRVPLVVPKVIEPG